MESMKNILYNFLVKSNILWYLMPILKYFFIWRICRSSNANHFVIDDDGATIHANKVDGKVYPPFGLDILSRMKKLKIRQDDVLICGYPKSGCHWIFEVVRMLLRRTSSLSKFGKEHEGFIEFLPEYALDSLPSPRVLNTHFSYDDLPQEIKDKRTKIVLTTRCPKDTVVSNYNHHINLKPCYKYDGKFENFFKLFMRGEVSYGCYYKTASDWQRVLKSPSTPNPIFVVKYEEMLRNPVKMIKKLARFLDVDVSDTFMEEIARQTEFKTVKIAKRKDSFLLGIYRKGIVGDWKNWLNEKQNAEMDAMPNVELTC